MSDKINSLYEIVKCKDKMDDILQQCDSCCRYCKDKCYDECVFSRNYVCEYSRRDFPREFK